MNNLTKKFNIRPFALPNTPANEVWFEQPRDIARVVVHLRSQTPADPCLSYRKKYWPERRFEQSSDLEDPGAFGWQPMDDWFNGEWKKAHIQSAQEGDTLAILFQPLTTEYFEGDWSGYDVTFRRTMAIRLDRIPADEIASIDVYIRSASTSTRIRVELDAGQHTPGQEISFENYNANITALQAIKGISVKDGTVIIGDAKKRVFELDLDHLAPPNGYIGDDANLTFNLDQESFTITLADLAHKGPIWFAQQDVYITLADSPLEFEVYRAGPWKRPILEMVKERGDQSLQARSIARSAAIR